MKRYTFVLSDGTKVITHSCTLSSAKRIAELYEARGLRVSQFRLFE